MSDKPHGPMTGANPGSDGSWFDQDLYDAVMDGQMEPIGAFSGESAYRMGYEAAAKRAARIAAERQPVAYIGVDTTVPLPPLSDEETADLREIAHEYQPVSDEELAAIFADAIEASHTRNPSTPDGQHIISGLRAVRAAIEAAKESD